MESQHDKTFVQDNDGDRYVCEFDDDKLHSHEYEELNDEEKSHCRPIEFPWN